MPIQLSCKTCGKQFTVSPSAILNRSSKHPGRKYCSYDCALADPERMAHRRTKPAIKKCQHCGKEYEYIDGKNGKKYCSQTCYHAASFGSNNGRYIEPIRFNCAYCGKVATRPPSQDRGYKNLYCSPECHYEHRIQAYAGDWENRDRQDRGQNWHRQRNKARKRDKYTCQHCGITENQLGCGLDVHHITPFRTFNGDWRQANELSNLISLCRSCHRSIEKSIT